MSVPPGGVPVEIARRNRTLVDRVATGVGLIVLKCAHGLDNHAVANTVFCWKFERYFVKIFDIECLGKQN